jgi:O-acetyl-ADP-ribose deacetylase (regulator of RNase III)
MKTEKLTKQERLDSLVEAFKADSEEYKDLETPADTVGKQRLLRSLMNIRMPRPMAKETILIQDEYLQERAEERGIIHLDDIPSIAESLGSKRPFADILSLWQGDITRLAADAIVNAANSQMLGCFQPCHSCIDNCIHTFAGIQLRAECHQQMQALRSRYGRDYEQPTAVPMLTDGYNLPAKKVVHIVGPIVYDSLTPELENDLADCYRNTLALCAENCLRSVAFCSISTGVFRFPKERASEIAVQTVTEWLTAHLGAMDRVIFNVFSDRDRSIYEQNLR